MIYGLMRSYKLDTMTVTQDFILATDELIIPENNKLYDGFHMVKEIDGIEYTYPTSGKLKQLLE